MQSESIEVSPVDLLASILKIDSVESMTVLLENRDVMMLLTTSFAVLIGLGLVMMWRRSTTTKSVKKVEPAKIVIPKFEMEEEEADDGKKKVTIFYGTQTGTAEGFAKVCVFFFFFNFMKLVSNFR